MFDLNKSVENWRSSLLQRESVSASEVDELESHLRDSVDALSSSELSAEEAFWVATRRVGSPEAIALEFTKINGARTWSRRVQWMLAGYLLISLTISLMSLTRHFTSLTAIHFDAGFRLTWFISSLVTIATVTLLVLAACALAEGRSQILQPLFNKFSGAARSSYRWWLVALAMLFVLLKTGASLVIGVLFTRLLSPAKFGTVAIVESSNSWLGQFLVVSAVVGLLCWLTNRDDGQRDRRIRKSGIVIMVLLLISVFGLMSFSLEHIYGTNFLQ